jgi:glycosyltransferase involved in cell wall biosynthesis
MLLDGAIRFDQRVIKVIRTLSPDMAIDLFYLDGHADDPKLFGESVRLFSMPAPRGFRAKLLENSLFFRTLDVLAERARGQGERYDIVYCNDLPTLHAGVVLAKAQGARLVYDSHEIFVETLNQFFPSPRGVMRKILAKGALAVMKTTGRRAEARYLRRVDHFITVNQSLADYFAREYGFPGTIHVVMNCPDRSRAEATPTDLRGRFGWNQTDVILLLQGSLNPGRGLDVMLRALARAEPRFKMVILGDGPLRGTVESRVSELGLDERVRLLGYVPSDEVPPYTRGADAGINLVEPINLSKAFTSATKLFDYIQAGLPSISSRSIENERVMSKYRVGLLVENETDAVASAIAQLGTPEARAAFRDACRAAHAEYNWERQAEVLKGALRIRRTT